MLDLGTVRSPMSVPCWNGTVHVRRFILPKDVYLPLDRISFNFARSSGPGGQNVNKLNTKSEARFHVDSADWIEPEVRKRIHEYHGNRVNKDGELIVTSQEHRTQMRNKDDCITKLRELIAEASVPPKDRHLWEGISDRGKERRKDEKRKRGDVKKARGKNSKDFFD